MSLYILPVFYSLLQILLLAGIGFVLRKYARWDSGVFSGISKLIVSIALPSMFIARMSALNRVDMKAGIIFPFYAVLIITLSLALSFILMKMTGIPREKRKAFIALSAFGNVGYIPLALIDIFEANLGNFGTFFSIPQPSLFIGSYLLVYSPVIWSFGNQLITGSSEKLQLKKLITPPVVGILIGIFLSLIGFGKTLGNGSLPFLYIHSALQTLGSVTSPLILIILGASIGELDLRKSFRSVDVKIAFFPMIIRYFLLPSGFLLLLTRTDLAGYFPPAVLLIMFIETIVPPPANYSVMTRSAGKNVETTALTLMVTYLSYLVFLPVYMMLFLKAVSF